MISPSPLPTLGNLVASMLEAIRPFLPQHQLTFLALDPSGRKRHVLIGDSAEDDLIGMLGDLKRRHIDIIRNGEAKAIEMQPDPFDEAIEMLRGCALLFREYEAHHREQAAQLPESEPFVKDRERKAERNSEIASRIEALLGRIAPEVVSIEITDPATAEEEENKDGE